MAKFQFFLNFLKISRILKIYHQANDIYLYYRPFIWYLFINEFIFDFYILEGESMLPTFESYGNIVFVEKLTSNKFIKKIMKKNTENYKRGEIVCVINPLNHDMKLCKRIIHIEGDEVKLRNGNTEIIPPNHVWVEGDNKDNSMDSRRFGAIPKQLVIGRVPFLLWPKFKFL